MRQGWGVSITGRVWHYFVGPLAFCGARRPAEKRLYTVRPTVRLCDVCDRAESTLPRVA